MEREKGRGEIAEIALSELELGVEASVVSLEARGELRRRLVELGFFPGERVKKVLKSPLGDPSAYLARGAVTAIRSADAAKVLVRALGGNEGEELRKKNGAEGRNDEE